MRRFVSLSLNFSSSIHRVYSLLWMCLNNTTSALVAKFPDKHLEHDLIYLTGCLIYGLSSLSSTLYII